jgi:hypothetical protein
LGIYLISIWLLAGALALIMAHRPQRTMDRTRRVELLAVGLFLLGVISGVASVATRDPWSTVFVWLALGFVNFSLATAGWGKAARILAALGSLGTVAALTLIALGSFSSLPVIAAAGVLCLAAALLARSMDNPVTPAVGQR